jgi:hypothetical protein
LFARPYLEKYPTQKMASGVTYSVGPDFKPQYHTYTQIVGYFEQLNENKI